MNEIQIPIADGKVLTTKVPGFHLIPTESLVRLAERFQLGIDKKGKMAWNSLTDNQEVLTNKELIFDRIGHIIHHCLKLRDKILKNEDPLEEDDDAGAISWGGAFLCCVTRKLKERRD